MFRPQVQADSDHVGLQSRHINILAFSAVSSRAEVRANISFSFKQNSLLEYISVASSPNWVGLCLVIQTLVQNYRTKFWNAATSSTSTASSKCCHLRLNTISTCCGIYPDASEEIVRSIFSDKFRGLIANRHCSCVELPLHDGAALLDAREQSFGELFTWPTQLCSSAGSKRIAANLWVLIIDFPYMYFCF